MTKQNKIPTVAEINATPYMQGYKAYNERKGVTDNPHVQPPEGTDDKGVSDYWQWYAGWSKANIDDGN